jgi:hypothetical protein
MNTYKKIGIILIIAFIVIFAIYQTFFQFWHQMGWDVIILMISMIVGAIGAILLAFSEKIAEFMET